ncbi:MAG: hypothetical protein R2826_03695 [Thermoleophilia bacterium]
MGLQCWIANEPNEPQGLSAQDVAPFIELHLPLCDWSVRSGSVSFSGKRYLTVAYEVAGISLGRPWISPETVGDMATRFARLDPIETVEELNATDIVYATTPLSVDEYNALLRLFQTCTAASLGICSDW